MRDLFKKLFGSREPESVTIAFDSIPAMLNEREAAACRLLKEQTEKPEQNIRNAIAQLQLIITTIAGAEHDSEIHPKLKNIAKNTLPQYIRAMNTALAKELPVDIELFYPAVVECVKNCLNSINGPGRYLQIVFPDEMKASRKGIDAIGHEINVITAALGVYRKEMTAITGARTIYAAIHDSTGDLEKTVEKGQRAIQRIREAAERIAEIDRDMAAISSDPRMAETEEKKSVIRTMEQQREEMARTYAAHSMTASHVLRKAEKIASKQKHTGEVGTLKHAMSLLSDHELPDSTELATALAAACPIAERMIAAGEVALKNKEERTIFTDTVRFGSEMGRICAELHMREIACRSAHEEILAHPLIVKAGSLEREKTQLGAMLEKEQHAQKELEDWQQKTREHIPVLRKELKNKVGEIMGRTVQYSDDFPSTA
ncbi:MAG: hypothetical protein M0Q92_08560 [Methanoregula sp.]|jgi:hypothetical protein|nr:hypothetical protein [Methanoregula sp.]